MKEQGKEKEHKVLHKTIQLTLFQQFVRYPVRLRRGSSFVVYLLLPEAREIFNQIVSHLFKSKSENNVN